MLKYLKENMNNDKSGRKNISNVISVTENPIYKRKNYLDWLNSILDPSEEKVSELKT